MHRNFCRRWWSAHGAAALVLAGFLVVVIACAARAAQKIQLGPKFAVGQTFLYRIDAHRDTSGNTTTPIVDPEGVSQVKRSVSLDLRLDVEDVSAPGMTPALARLRFTFEKSNSTSQTDAYDPASAELDDGYKRLEGRSFASSIAADGTLSDLTGLEGLQPRVPIEGALRTWISRITFADTFPRGGIAVGQHWTAEKPVVGAPLRGLLWRAESSYLRNEPCHAIDTSRAGGASASAAAVSPAAAPRVTLDTCAVILTRYAIVRHGGSHGDATPPDYLHSGLRTSGTWTGSGETLDSISLTTGMLTVSTETVSEQMDYQVRSEQTGSTLRYKGKTDSQTQITLLPRGFVPAPSP
jgi:hypothetical protein